MVIDMDIDAIDKMAKELRIAEELLSIRTARINGVSGYSIKEAREILVDTIEKVDDANKFIWQ